MRRIRRLCWLTIIAAAIAATIVATRRRHRNPSVPAAAAWPPIQGPTEPAAPAEQPVAEPPTAATAATAAAAAAAAAGAATVPVRPATSAPTDLAAVNALAGEVVAPRRWVDPRPDGSCPDGYPIKANDNSGIYHVPGGRSYERTKAERCYANVDDAQADGYRAAKA